MTGGKWRVTSAEREKLAELEWQVWASVGKGWVGEIKMGKIGCLCQNALFLRGSRI